MSSSERRRGWRLAAVLALSFLAVPVAAHPQQTGKVWRVGYLALAPDAGHFRDRFTIFRDGLRALEYVEGHNLRVERRYAGGRPERMPALAAELVGLKVDVVVVWGGASAAKQLTNTLPIVFVAEPDPVGAGLVASLARPGGNVTGLSDSHADLVPKRLELLKEAVPLATRVAFLLKPANPNALPQLRAAQAAGLTLGLAVVPAEVKGSGRDDIDRAFAAMERERAAALVVFGDATLSVHRTRIAELAIKHRLPTTSTVRTWAEAGLLMAYGADFGELFRRAATYVDKILKGVNPADLPVEQPTKFDLVVNLKTAKALGLTLPPSLLLRANDVIQ